MEKVKVRDLAPLGMSTDKVLQSMKMNATMLSESVRVSKNPLRMTHVLDSTVNEFDFAGTSLADVANDESITTLTTANKVDSNEYWYVPTLDLQVTKADGTAVTGVQLALLNSWLEKTVVTVSQGSDNIQFKVTLAEILGNGLNLTGDGTTIASNISMSVAKGQFNIAQTPLEFGAEERFNFKAKTYGSVDYTAINGVFDIRLGCNDRLKVSNIK